MKKIKTIISVFVFVGLLSACGSSKQAATPGGTIKGSEQNLFGADINSPEAQLLAEACPATRGWGEATNNRLSFARNYAEGHARAELARAVAAIIKTATKESDLQWTKYAGTSDEGQSVTDEGSKADGKTLQIAEELVENAVVIKTNQYMKPNRQYHVFVCVEYMGDATQMGSKIVDKVKQLVPDEDRIKMEYQFQKFEEEIEKELAEKKKGVKSK